MHAGLEPEHELGRSLRALPAAAARPYGFAEFERRATRRVADREAAHGGQALAAAIAVVALTLAALSVRFAGSPAGHPAPEATAPIAAVPPVSAARLDAMEYWLAGLPSDPALVRVGSRAAVTGLEDRIAQVDDLLSAARAEQALPARVSALQEQRHRLVGALVQVRYAETLADVAR